MASNTLSTRNSCTIDPDGMEMIKHSLDKEILYSKSLLQHFDGKLKKCLDTCTSEEEIADTRFEVDYMKEYITEHIKEIENVIDDMKGCDSDEFNIMYERLYGS